MEVKVEGVAWTVEGVLVSRNLWEFPFLGMSVRGRSQKTMQNEY